MPDQLNEPIHGVSFDGDLKPIVDFGKSLSRPEKIIDRMAHYKTPAVSMALIQNFKVVQVLSYGRISAGNNSEATPNTLFQAASISKSVSAMAALALVRSGKIELNSDTAPYLRPWIVPLKSGQHNRPITLKSILNHSAGINIDGFPGYARGAKLPNIDQILAGAPPSNTPPVQVESPEGQFKYSGGGYAFLQKLIAKLTSETFQSSIDALIFHPLNLKNSSFNFISEKNGFSIARGTHWDGGEVAKGWHVYPELAPAGLWTTASDLATIMIDLQLAAAKDQGRVLSQDLAQKMLTTESGSPMGLGMFVKKTGEGVYFQHSGWNEGYISQIYGDLHGNGVVILTNGEQFALIMEILDAVGTEFRWPGYPRPRMTAISINRKILSNFSGKYKSENGETWYFSENSGRLFMRMPVELLYQPIEVFESSGGEFFSVAPSMKIKFGRNNGGLVHVDVLDGAVAISKLVKIE